jgi:ubiquinone/menaquinone biosynthesis C-methylase UbiE
VSQREENVNQPSEHERRFTGTAERLRSPERLARLEAPRVVGLCLRGLVVSSVLDVGTGAGVFAEAFAAQGLTVAGVDTNAALLEAARLYVPTADLSEGAAEALPYPDTAFDLVFLGHVLHETDRPLEALREARRVARLRVAVLEWPYREESMGPPLAHRLSPERVAELAEQAGFAQAKRLDLKHTVLYRLDVA